ncbi:MAG: hypothetical protein ACAH89_03115 [Rariglobus sp.]|nr:hypothetical protein [Rariglobus sp.]
MSQPAHATESEPTGIAAWRILLRMLAGFLALFSFAFWAAAGWNKGWTKTRIAVTEIEPITHLPHTVYKDHFMPGMELFVPALLLCLALFAITFIRRKAR